MATNNATNTSNPITVAQGGTGLATLTAHAVQVGNGTGNVTQVAVGSANSVFMGSAGDPAFTTSGTAYFTGVSFDSGSNTLSTYTVGTFTPTFVGASTAGTTTYTVQNGYYVRIGAMVQVQGIVVGTGATGTGDIQFGSLPFTVKNQTNGNTFGSILTSQSWAWPASKTQILFNPVANSTAAFVAGIQSNGSTSNVQMTNASFNMQFNVVYEI